MSSQQPKTTRQIIRFMNGRLRSWHSVANRALGLLEEGRTAEAMSLLAYFRSSIPPKYDPDVLLGAVERKE